MLHVGYPEPGWQADPGGSPADLLPHRYSVLTESLCMYVRL